MYDTRKETVRRAQHLKESAEWHRRTYRAIRQHKVEEARETMRENLTRARMAQKQEAVTTKEKETNSRATLELSRHEKAKGACHEGHAPLASSLALLQPARTSISTTAATGVHPWSY
jgi:hypothetical protein